jgi:hypothetical protein
MVRAPYGSPHTPHDLEGPEFEYDSDDEIPPLTQSVFDYDSDDEIQEVIHPVHSAHNDLHDVPEAHPFQLNRAPYGLPNAPSEMFMTDHNVEHNELHTRVPLVEQNDDETSMPSLETIPPGEDTCMIGWNPAYSQIDLTHFDDRLVLTPEDWSSATHAMARLDLHPGSILYPKSMLNSSPLVVTIPGNITNKIYPSGGTFTGTKLRGHFVAIPTYFPGVHTVLLDHRLIQRGHNMLEGRHATLITERDRFRTAITRHIMDLIHAYFRDQYRWTIFPDCVPNTTEGPVDLETSLSTTDPLHGSVIIMNMEAFMDNLVENYYREKLILDLPTDIREFTMHENPEWHNFQIVLIVGGEREASCGMGRHIQDQMELHPDDDHGRNRDKPDEMGRSNQVGTEPHPIPATDMTRTRLSSIPMMTAETKRRNPMEWRDT